MSFSSFGVGFEALPKRMDHSRSIAEPENVRNPLGKSPEDTTVFVVESGELEVMRRGVKRLFNANDRYVAAVRAKGIGK